MCNNYTNMNKVLYFTLGLLIFMACSQDNEKADVAHYKTQGDSVANAMQQLLLKNVREAVSDSGFAYAVDYCQANAGHIIGTGEKNANIRSIERKTDKPRNQNNALVTDQDKAVFKYFKSTPNDTAVVLADEVVYYKPIHVMMPTCLKCHGKKENLDPELLETVNEKYPRDLAVDYEQGELRGMWKIALPR